LFGYFNVEIPYFRGILVLTVKSQRATFGILGGAWPPCPPPLNPPTRSSVRSSLCLGFVIRA